MSTSYHINIDTNLLGNHWIRVRRNNRYIPTSSISPKLKPRTNSSEWITVSSKKKEKLIYYWSIENHNLFDCRDLSYKLYFMDPDLNNIFNMDKTPCMVIDDKKKLHKIYTHLKYHNIKMTPNYIIARNISQVIKCLQYVKLCAVKIDNNEQILKT